jgi:hypothetical protein
MPDICDLILDEHETFRRRFADLDAHRDTDADTLGTLWQPLAELLDRHAAAEEGVFYPQLLAQGVKPEDETDDAIDDHNAIRDAVADAARHTPGSQQWWSAVTQDRQQNSDHMAEEERGALADFRAHTGAGLRDELGQEFETFNEAHPRASGIEDRDKDPEAYLRRNE